MEDGVFHYCWTAIPNHGSVKLGTDPSSPLVVPWHDVSSAEGFLRLQQVGGGNNMHLKSLCRLEDGGVLMSRDSHEGAEWMPVMQLGVSPNAHIGCRGGA